MIRSVGSGDGAGNEKVKPQEVISSTDGKVAHWVSYFLSLHKDMFALIFKSRNTDVIVYEGKTIVLSDPAVRRSLCIAYPLIQCDGGTSIENGEGEDKLIGMNPRID